MEENKYPEHSPEILLGQEPEEKSCEKCGGELSVRLVGDETTSACSNCNE